MAVRPLAFGARFVHRDRTLRIQADPAAPGRYAVEELRRDGPPRVTGHASLASAIRQFAAAWRSRLH